MKKKRRTESLSRDFVEGFIPASTARSEAGQSLVERYSDEAVGNYPRVLSGQVSRHCGHCFPPHHAQMGNFWPQKNHSARLYLDTNTYI